MSPNSQLILLIVVGIVFHGIYTMSMFDIYFRSPLVHGMPKFQIEMEPVADRLFLFVGKRI